MEKWFFSLKSGEVYSIDENLAPFMDNQQVRLTQKPPSSCSKCNGKFYTSYYITGKRFEICKKCAKKCIDKDAYYGTQNK